MAVLTQERLKELLYYDPELGWFMWKQESYNLRIMPGDVAGNFHNFKCSGYIIIQIDGEKYKAHRLAWFYMTGSWPANYIDHIDGDRSNNRWANLRDVTHAVNHQNRKAYPTNTSGYVGVQWNARLNKWRAVIKANGKRFSLGCYTCKEAANQAYIQAKERYHG